MSRRQVTEKDDPLPHPAEDLSADDDLLSWILVDQLGCLPNTKLGVHPQQVKFVGPSFKTEEILNIVNETVVKGNLQLAMAQLQEHHLIKAHLAGKTTDGQRERFIQHLRRYLIPLLPSSKVEMHTTSRYSDRTGHVELAVYATRPLERGAVLQELQGSVVPLPEEWREEMEIGEDFALQAKGDEDGSASDVEEDEDEGEDDEEANEEEETKRRVRVEKERQKGARRSDRTKRRDFSIVWSGLKRCFQLFLGPARFINHDCAPNVELLRQGKFVTFRVIRPIRIGEELTTFYGENYFGKENNECLCLSCEQADRGGFTPQAGPSRSQSREVSIAPSNSVMSNPSLTGTPRKGKSRQSMLRHVIGADDENESPNVERSHKGKSPLRTGEASPSDMGMEVDSPFDGPSQSMADEDECNAHGGSFAATQSRAVFKAEDEDGSSSRITAQLPTPDEVDDDELGASPAAESEEEDGSSSDESVPILRERSSRLAKLTVKPWAYMRRIPRKSLPTPDETTEADDDYPEDFPRCVTCVRPLTERVWYYNRYFDHCTRCIRHALIFNLPWPAHRAQDVQDYPPSHLVPNGYVPRKISYYALPTLAKTLKKRTVDDMPPTSPVSESREDKRARRFRQDIEREEWIVGLLRSEAWSTQETKEIAAAAQAAAKAEQKRKKDEAKEKRDASSFKGSGVWSRWAYVSDEEFARKQAQKFMVTSGTRRGGRFRDSEDEEEMRRLAEEQRRADRAAAGIAEVNMDALRQPEANQEDVSANGEAEWEDASAVAGPSGTTGSADEDEEDDVDDLNTPPVPLFSARKRNSTKWQGPEIPKTGGKPRTKRGRPPGTGKHQKKAAAAARAAEKRIHRKRTEKLAEVSESTQRSVSFGNKSRIQVVKTEEGMSGDSADALRQGSSSLENKGKARAVVGWEPPVQQETTVVPAPFRLPLPYQARVGLSSIVNGPAPVSRSLPLVEKPSSSTVGIRRTSLTPLHQISRSGPSPNSRSTPSVKRPSTTSTKVIDVSSPPRSVRRIRLFQSAGSQAEPIDLDQSPVIGARALSPVTVPDSESDLDEETASVMPSGSKLGNSRVANGFERGVASPGSIPNSPDRRVSHSSALPFFQAIPIKNETILGGEKEKESVDDASPHGSSSHTLSLPEHIGITSDDELEEEIEVRMSMTVSEADEEEELERYRVSPNRPYTVVGEDVDVTSRF